MGVKSAISAAWGSLTSVFGSARDQAGIDAWHDGYGSPPGRAIVSNPYPTPYAHPQDLDRYGRETDEMRMAYQQFYASEPAFQSAIDGKVAAVSCLDVSILPADESNDRDKRAAEFVRDAVANAPGGWSGLIESILRPAFLTGFSITEKVFGGIADDAWSFRIRSKWPALWAPRRLASIDTHYLRLQVDQFREVVGILNTRRGLEGYSPDRVIVYTHRKLFENPYGRSDCRSAYRACQMIENAYKLWYIAIKNYSAPFVTVKTKAQGAVLTALKKALEAGRAGGWLTVGTEDDLELLNFASATGFQAFERKVMIARQEVYLAVRGAFLPFLEGSQNDGRGDSSVHKVASDAIEALLVQSACEAVNHQLIPDLVITNFGPDCGIPTMSLGGTNWQETKTQLDVIRMVEKELGRPVSSKLIYKVSQQEPPRDDGDGPPPPPPPPPPAMGPTPGGYPFAATRGKEEFIQTNPMAYADVIVRNAAGDVLVLKRRADDSFMPGRWCLPGGKIDDGETPEKAALRELKEETGIVPAGKLKPSVAWANPDGSVSHYFIADAMNYPLKGGNEHELFGWCPIEALAGQNTIPGLSYRVESCLNIEQLSGSEGGSAAQPAETFSANYTFDAEDCPKCGVSMEGDSYSGTCNSCGHKWGKKSAFSDVADEPDPPDAPVAGPDARAAIRLAQTAMNEGRAVLESITTDAVKRKLNGSTGDLFNAGELARLADAIAATNATAELLGRYRIREQVESQAPKRFARFDAGANPERVRPLPPKEALRYFQRLMPSLSAIPDFNERHQRTSFTLAARTGDVILRQIQTAINNALASGETGTPAVQELLDRAGVSTRNPQYADMVFRTNAIDSLNAGFDAERQAPDVVEEFPVWQYQGIADGRQGKDHNAHFGKFYPSVATFAEVRGERPFNCILPGQYVQGRIKTALKSFYSGKAVEIHTASGCRFSLTVNHPVLTDKGFLPAGVLKKFDNTIRHHREDKVKVVEVDKHHSPALIEDVFESMAVVFDGPRRTPMSLFDFHGDAVSCVGEVEVVRADWGLQFAGESLGKQSSMESMFSGAGVTLQSEPSRSTLDLYIQRIRHAAACGMGGNNLPLTSGGIHPAPLEYFRVGTASNLDIIHLETASQGAPANTGLVGQLLQRFPGEISCDEIIEIRHFDYNGHVYDLETDVGYLTLSNQLQGASTVISNCRCSLRAVNRREWARRQSQGASVESSW